MKEIIKKILLRLNLLGPARRFDFYNNLKYRINHKKKQDVLLGLQRKFLIGTLIETGTYLGDMVYAMRDHFKKIYSIELSNDLYRSAVKRFRKDINISILNGNSGELLISILSNIDEPCLFWLDAHYSAGVTTKGRFDTPIAGELDIILGHKVKKHVIAIDDASSFTGENGYPTIEAINELILTRSNNYRVEIVDNIIIIL